MSRKLDQMERTCRVTGAPLLPTFLAYIQEWFHKDTLQPPRKENMDELFSWAFFGKDQKHLEPWMAAELQLVYDLIESRCMFTFPPGYTPGLRPMRYTLDPLEPSYRPLATYALFGSMQVFASLFLSACGFSFYTSSNGLRYWYRAPLPASEPYTQLPLLFFHGIAPGGVALYLPMLLWGLGCDGRPLMLFENPAISFSMCLNSHTETETVEGVWEAVQTHLPDSGVSVVGHSFGSCQLTWLLHSQEAHRIRQVVLMDPVSVLLSEPDVMTNFLYARKALQRRGKIGVVANELFVEHYLRRQFAWYNSELWLEDIPSHCKVVVCLSDKDEILNAHKIKREIDIQLSEKGGKLDLILWEGGRHAYCVSRPDAWRQLRLTMRRQEQQIAKQELK
jgi:pimeloyl-ACP methyl ester carboxylesterase